MIRLDLTNETQPLWTNFFSHISDDHPYLQITGDTLNDALVKYHAVYHVQDVGNMFESKYEEWVEFKSQEDYIMFILSWS